MSDTQTIDTVTVASVTTEGSWANEPVAHDKPPIIAVSELVTVDEAMQIFKDNPSVFTVATISGVLHRDGNFV